MKLGKQPPKHDARTIQLESYIDDTQHWWTRFFRHRHHHPHPTPTPPPPSPTNPPPSVTESTAIAEWPVFANDQYGDCVEAAMGHIVELLSKLGQGTEATVTNQDVLKVYSDLTGFNPNDPSTDNGTVMLDALNYWRKTGIAGHTIYGFAQFDPKSVAQWELANYLFGNTYVGLALPVTAQNQVGNEWTVVSTSGDGQPGSWGGHCVPFVDYYSDYVDCITWGQVQKANWQFISTYCDEAYVVFDLELLNRVNDQSPQGFNINQLIADLGQFHK